MQVKEHGPAGAPTIVLVHGGGVGAWSWEPQVRNLSREYHLLVPSLPGHDGTPALPELTVAACAELVADLIRTRAHGGRAHVVGLSLGAQTLVRLLATAPELVDHAILTGCNVRGIPGLKWIGPLVKISDPFKSFGFMIKANMKQADIPEVYLNDFKQDAARMSAADLIAILTASGTFTLPAGLGKAPGERVLVAMGGHEQRLIHQSLKDLLAAMDGARGVLSPGVGHTWNLARAERFNAMVRAFISDQPLPDGLIPIE